MDVEKESAWERHGLRILRRESDSFKGPNCLPFIVLDLDDRTDHSVT